MGCRHLKIAIDGPGAAGKTSVGREVAHRLGYAFVDTGLLYRALTWVALSRGISADDDAALTALAQEIHVELYPAPPEAVEPTVITVDGQDITPFLRHPKVEEVVSRISQIASVREALLGLQRRLAQQGCVVVAGRDIGTVVLPDADVKVYLDAPLAERARRRLRQLRELGQRATLQEVMRELQHRDEMDSHRPVAPLRPAPDAVIIDTEGLSLEQVVERVMSLVEARCA